MVAMDSRRMLLLPLKLTCLLFMLLSYDLLPKAKSETDYGCSVPNIDLLKCLNQSKNSLNMEESCCKTLNQIAEAGFKSLCSLRTSLPIALVGLPLSLSFLNCFISMPPLSHCPALAPMEVLVAPESPKDQNQLSSPPDVDVVVSYSPPTNLTAVHHDDDDEHSVLPNGELNSNTSRCLWLTLFLFLPFWLFNLL